jgi:hypothetical protein
MAIFAEKDEFGDRPAEEIVRWFEANTRAPLMSLVVRDAGHGFNGSEKPVTKAIKSWVVNK